MKPEVCAIIGRAYSVSPVQEVVVVNHAASKITLAQYGDMVSIVVIGIWSHKTVDQTRLPDTDDSFLPLRARQTNHCYVEVPHWR